jgi:HipA-like C-terminal domain
MTTYQIVSIPLAARRDIEPLGSKAKFWVSLDGQLWLFKEARDNTGEDWAEKIAAELAKLIGIDAAEVELAEFSGRRGCVCRSFVDLKKGEGLVHGNEILSGFVTGYEREKRFKQSDHTLDNIVRAIQFVFSGKSADSVLARLARYVVFDALIANTDRHHENWGLKLGFDAERNSYVTSVAPSFDHASSLGRELLDAKRSEMLGNNEIVKYVSGGRGGIFVNAADKRGANPLELVRFGAAKHPEHFRGALAELQNLERSRIRFIINNVPQQRASTISKDFAYAVICHSLDQLLKLQT